MLAKDQGVNVEIFRMNYQGLVNGIPRLDNEPPVVCAAPHIGAHLPSGCACCCDSCQRVASCLR